MTLAPLSNYLVFNIFLGLSLIWREATSHNVDGPQVQIPALQANILGLARESEKGIQYYEFLGIKYAEKPVRFQRTKLAEPLDTVDGEYLATNFGSVCYQHIPDPHLPGVSNNTLNEDCLYLNIYTPKLPAKQEEKLPVLFFIHGGAFIRWASNPFNGSRFTNENVVVVTINYRLGVFGFFTNGTDKYPGNLGLYDQLLALQWTNKYIENFGGDPAKVTIAGQSAGAVSVTLLLGIANATGLFHRAIISSGDALSGWARHPMALEESANLTQQWCNTEPDISLCLESLDAFSIVNDTKEYSLWVPSVQDDRYDVADKILLKAPEDSLYNPESRVPIMLGTNRNDGTFLLSLYYTRNRVDFDDPAFVKHGLFWKMMASSNFGVSNTPPGTIEALERHYLGNSSFNGNMPAVLEGLSNVFSAYYFKVVAYKRALAFSNFTNVYLYSFDYSGDASFFPITSGPNSENITKGAAHIDDMLYIFPMKDISNETDAISRDMLSFYVNFVTNGSPDNENSWPRFQSSYTAYRKIGSTTQSGIDFVGEWNKFRE